MNVYLAVTWDGYYLWVRGVFATRELAIEAIEAEFRKSEDLESRGWTECVLDGWNSWGAAGTDAKAWNLEESRADLPGIRETDEFVIECPVLSGVSV